MGSRAGTGLRRRCAALITALLLATTACADLAASTGTDEDQLISEIHSQVQTAFLVAEAGLEDPPAPAVTLTSILDNARSELTSAREDLVKLPGDHGELLALADSSVELVGQMQGAVESGDREALRETRQRAEELATALEDRSALL